MAAKNHALEGSDTKKTFLKRKSVEPSAKKGAQTTAKKSYKYYVDNFTKEGSGKVKLGGRGGESR